MPAFNATHPCAPTSANRRANPARPSSSVEPRGHHTHASDPTSLAQTARRWLRRGLIHMRQAIPVWPYGALAELADIRRVTAVGLYGAAAGVTYYSVCLLRHISRINMYESPFRSMTHLAMGQYVVVVAGAVAGALNSAAVVHLQARLPHEREATVISGAVDGMVAFGFFGFATAVHGYIRRMEAAVYPGDAYPDNAVSRGPVFGGYLTDSSATSRHVSVVAPTCYAWDRPMMDDA